MTQTPGPIGGLQPEYPQHPYGVPPQPPVQKARKWPWILAIIGAFLVGLIAGGVDGNDNEPTATTTVTASAPAEKAEPTSTTVSVPKEAKPKPKPEQSSTVEDGDYLVGSEIEPGTYKSSGNTDIVCYADTQKRNGDILEQEVGDDGEKLIIEIRANAYKFSSSDCGGWKKIG